MSELLLILMLGIFVGFFVQTVVGFAGSLTALPILLFVMPLANAISYLSIFYFISAPIYMYREWGNIDKAILKKIAVSSFVGVILGIIVLRYGKPVILKKGLGIFIVLFVFNSLFNKKRIDLPGKAKYFFGFLGGFFSGVFSTGGPLYVMIVKNETPTIKTFRATMLGVLGLVTLIRLPALAIGGLLTLHELYNSLYALPLFFMALFLGKKVYLKLNENVLKKVVLGLLFVSGILLLLKS